MGCKSTKTIAINENQSLFHFSTLLFHFYRILLYFQQTCFHFDLVYTKVK